MNAVMEFKTEVVRVDESAPLFIKIRTIRSLSISIVFELRTSQRHARVKTKKPDMYEGGGTSEVAHSSAPWPKVPRLMPAPESSDAMSGFSARNFSANLATSGLLASCS